MIFTVEEIKNILITHYGGEDEYNDFIDEAKDLETKISNYLITNEKSLLNNLKSELVYHILDELTKEAKGYGIFC
jgi:hypothetical protein